MILITDIDYERLKNNLQRLNAAPRDPLTYAIVRANTSLILDNIKTLMSDPKGRLK